MLISFQATIPNFPIEFISALFGALVALAGSFLVNIYQNHLQRKHLRNALIAEIDLMTQVLELIVCAARMRELDIDDSGQIDIKKTEISDLRSPSPPDLEKLNSIWELCDRFQQVRNSYLSTLVFDSNATK